MFFFLFMKVKEVRKYVWVLENILGGVDEVGFVW